MTHSFGLELVKKNHRRRQMCTDGSVLRFLFMAHPGFFFEFGSPLQATGFNFYNDIYWFWESGMKIS